MSTFKRIDGDYTIQSINDTDKIIIDSHRVEISGNLEVSGNLTYINTEELEVKDPFILLNTSNTSTYNSNSGVLTHKTSTTYAGIRYNNSAGQWELSISTDDAGTGGSWSPIATGNTNAAGSNTQVQFNDDGAFGAEANFTYDKDSNLLSLDGAMVLSDQLSVPSSVSNSTVIYANTVGSGGTGVYFVDGSTSDELVSKSKAIVYGIIF